MRVHSGKALIALVAMAGLAVTACSSSSGGGSPTSGAANPPASSGGSSSTSTGAQPAGTKGTGAFADCGTAADTCNTGTVSSGGSVSYVLEKTIPGWNINYTNDNVFELGEVLDALSPGAFTATPDLKPVLNTNLMVSATQTSASPQTIVYKIKPDAEWSDGTPINYADFLYLKDVSDDSTCPAAKCAPSTTAGYTDIKSMASSQGGKTVTVVMKQPFSDWESMFGNLYPAHIAAKNGGVKTAAGLAKTVSYFDKTVPTWSGGPYEITNYTKDTSIAMKPNPKWYGATKPSLTSLTFRIITDQTQEPAALSNNDVQALYSQPSLNLVQQVDAVQNVQTYLGKGLTWEHLDFNEKNVFFKDVKLRTAIFTAISRQDIIARTVGQFVPGVTPLGNHMYVPGQAGYVDNVTKTGQGSGNLAKAKSILTAAGYTGVGTTLKTPSGTAVHFACTYSLGNTNRQQTCEIVQAEMKTLGIPVTLRTTSDLHELGTGDYDFIVFAWVGAPFVVSGAQQIWEVNGGADYGHNVDPTVEKDINEAATKTNASQVQTLMNKADVALTADAYSLPLFQKPTFLATYANIANIRDNATSVGPPYNVEQWGLKS